MSKAVNLGCDPRGKAPRLAMSPNIADTTPALLAELHHVAAARYEGLDVAATAYFNATRGDRDRESWTPFQHGLEDAYVRAIADMIAAFGYFHCFAWLAKAAPDEAAKYVDNRRIACESGDAFGEWLWQWGCELVKGEPLTLPCWEEM
jgi:hypothetical protein